MKDFGFRKIQSPCPHLPRMANRGRPPVRARPQKASVGTGSRPHGRASIFKPLKMKGFGFRKIQSPCPHLRRMANRGRPPVTLFSTTGTMRNLHDNADVRNIVGARHLGQLSGQHKRVHSWRVLARDSQALRRVKRLGVYALDSVGECPLTPLICAATGKDPSAIRPPATAHFPETRRSRRSQASLDSW